MEFWEEQLERLQLLIHDRIDSCDGQFNIKSTWRKECENFLQKRGYVQTTFGFIKDFVIVKITDTTIIVEHDIPNSRPHVINKSHRSGLFVALNYYERL